MDKEQPGFGEAMAATLAQEQADPAMTENAEETELAYRYRQLHRAFIDMGQRAVSEIKYLRHVVATTRAKAEAYDVLSKVVLGGSRDVSLGLDEDIVWRIEQEIETLQTTDDRLDPSKHAHEV